VHYAAPKSRLEDQLFIENFDETQLKGDLEARKSREGEGEGEREGELRRT